jgi:CMP/dCMP kinase
MEAIILSGLPAAGKTTVAEIISKRLGFKVTGGGDILKEMATDRGYKVTGMDWWDTPDGVKFLREREGNPEFDKEADRRLAQKIEGGNIVVTSYTAPWITKKGFKVWLDGSVKNRTERMAKRDGTAFGEMSHVIKIRDMENKRLYKNLYNIDFGVDKTPFSLIVDTNSITAEEVADIIIKRYKERKEVI